MSGAVAGYNTHVLCETLSVVKIKRGAVGITADAARLYHEQGARGMVPNTLFMRSAEISQVQRGLSSCNEAVLDHAIETQGGGLDGQGRAQMGRNCSITLRRLEALNEKKVR
jgi:hypothetical protein